MSVKCPLLGRAVKPCRSKRGACIPASAGQWLAVPCGEYERAVPSPKIDSGEGFASEDAPPSSADADFLRIPGRTGQLSLVSSFARPIACPHSPPRRELTQRFQGSWPQPYASPPLRRPRLPEAATLGARRLAGDLPAAVSQSTNPIVTLQWRNVTAPWEPPASGRVEVLRH